MTRFNWKLSKVKESLTKAKKPLTKAKKSLTKALASLRSSVTTLAHFLALTALVTAGSVVVVIAIVRVVKYSNQPSLVPPQLPPSIAPIPAKPIVVNSSFQFAEQAVFKVLPGEGENKFQQTGGTGFLFETASGQRVILTNKHVCGVVGSYGTRLILMQGTRVYHTTIQYRSRLTDICVLNVPSALSQNPAYKHPRGDIAQYYKQGTILYVFGHPRLNPLTMTYGPMQNMTQDYFEELPDTRGFGRFQAEILPGSSGSPTVNEYNEVVGVVFAYERLPNQLPSSLFIPIQHAIDAIERQE